MLEQSVPELIFIGAGRMASAIVGGLIEQQHYAPGAIACTCGADPSGPALAHKTGILYAADITPLVETASIVVLACKPQQLGEIPQALADAARGKLIISILAGTPIRRLAKTFPGARNIVRTMPNTPGQIGAGVTAYAPMHDLEPTDQASLQTILGALGTVLAVAEEQLDAVTAISGSGPAYVFAFASALRDAGVRLGLDFETARILAEETILGSGLLLKRSEESAEALREAVTSPGGTTAAALKVLSDSNFDGLIASATKAAHSRSLELGAS